MTDHKLYDKFLEMFPNYKGKVMNYGHSSDGHEVQITTDDRDILLFTYQDASNWRLETMKSYVNYVGIRDELVSLKKNNQRKKHAQ